jgi:alkylated DNA repair protein alkB homolog 8
MNQDRENKILKDIEKGYDLMADKFSNTRKHFWNDFDFILDYIENNDKILDFGCGNGRLLELLSSKKIEYFGVDISQKLIDLAKKKYQSEKANFQKISSLPTLSFPDNFFNLIFSISVFHHFPKSYAKTMANEIYRLTAPGGIVIISVWNLWQKRYLKYLLRPEFAWKKIFRVGKFKDLGWRDILIPFKNNQGEVFYRFHHMFRKRELINIFEKAGFKIERSFILNRKNIVIVGRK